MARFAEWRESVDPGRPMERFDSLSLWGSSLGTALGASLCCGCASPFVFWLTWKATDRKLRHRRVHRLRDLPTVHPQVTAKLALESDGTVYGRDEGIVSLIDGTILFEGRRTSFSVRRSQIALEHLSRKGFSFRFRSPGGECRAVVDIADEDDMSVAIDEWRVHEENPNDLSVFPPVRPNRYVRRRLDFIRSFLNVCEIGGLLFCLLWGLTGEPATGLIASLYVTASWALLSVVLSGKRKRLDAIDQAALPSVLDSGRSIE